MSKRTATKGRKAWPCTAKDIIHQRDELELSWKAVGEVLSLGSPSAARNAYTELTGRPHYESQVKVNRAPRGTGKVAERKAVEVLDRHPHWDADSDQDAIFEAIGPVCIGHDDKGNEIRSYRTVIVSRNTFGMNLVEEMVVYRIRGCEFNKDETKLTISFWELRSGALRSVHVDDIIEVQ
jgi:hypothetical protein